MSRFPSGALQLGCVAGKANVPRQPERTEGSALELWLLPAQAAGPAPGWAPRGQERGAPVPGDVPGVSVCTLRCSNLKPPKAAAFGAAAGAK